MLQTNVAPFNSKGPNNLINKIKIIFKNHFFIVTLQPFIVPSKVVTTIDVLDGITLNESAASHLQQLDGGKHGTGTSKTIKELKNGLYYNTILNFITLLYVYLRLDMILIPSKPKVFFGLLVFRVKHS